MKIAISGSSGFVGSHLTRALHSAGIEVIPIPRALLSSQTELQGLIGKCQVVINLAGASINCRWTKKNKQKIIESRINTTRSLVNAIHGLPPAEKPPLFISTSAVGIYSSIGKQTDESQTYGNGFLTHVCELWEAEARRVDPTVRLVIPRFGIVLGRNEGALPLMLLPFRLGVGGKIGNGTQYLSWIHIDDLVRAFRFVIAHPNLSGTINFTSPYPVTNSRFAKIASMVLRRPNWLDTPGWIFRLLYGEGEQLITQGQQVFPTRLAETGFTFRYPLLTKALQDLTQ